MKLLLCRLCEDVFRILVNEERTCRCGRTKGRYEKDGLNAWYEGGAHAVPLGFANDSFIRAVYQQPASGSLGKEFTAFVIQKDCPTFKERK